MRIDIGALLAGKTDVVVFDILLPCPEGFGGIVFCGDVSVKGTVRNAAGYISMSAELSVPYRTNCARCAAVIEGVFSKSFSRVPVTHFDNEDVDHDDYLVISDYSIDIESAVNEELVLGFDSVYYCKEDCRGLCPVCGRDLNTGDCGCSSERKIDPRLLPLAALLEKMEEEEDAN